MKCCHALECGGRRCACARRSSDPPKNNHGCTSRHETINNEVNSTRISFCTTCANRLYQLRQTFDANIEVIRRDPATEWILLNYNSGDGLHEFMLERLPVLPVRFNYVREQSGRAWHLSVAKNIAHRLASGSVLINLDCDNFIGDAVEIVRQQCSRGAQVVHLWSGNWGDGTCGRIAILREIFYALGGYDESFYPMGYQDRDLLNRAAALGSTMTHCPCPPAMAIRNDKQEAIRYCTSSGMSWEDYMESNKKKSEANITARRLAANRTTGWGRLHVEMMSGQRGECYG
jgi:hypothetical protein